MGATGKTTFTVNGSSSHGAPDVRYGEITKHRGDRYIDFPEPDSADSVLYSSATRSPLKPNRYDDEYAAGRHPAVMPGRISHSEAEPLSCFVTRAGITTRQRRSPMIPLRSASSIRYRVGVDDETEDDDSRL